VKRVKEISLFDLENPGSFYYLTAHYGCNDMNYSSYIYNDPTTGIPGRVFYRRTMENINGFTHFR
jgi:hypothetical protein